MAADGQRVSSVWQGMFTDTRGGQAIGLVHTQRTGEDGQRHHGND